MHIYKASQYFVFSKEKSFEHHIYCLLVLHNQSNSSNMVILRWFSKIQVHTIVCISLVIFVEAYCSELKILIVVGRHINLKNCIIDDFNNGVRIYG